MYFDPEDIIFSYYRLEWNKEVILIEFCPKSHWEKYKSKYDQPVEISIELSEEFEYNINGSYVCYDSSSKAIQYLLELGFQQNEEFSCYMDYQEKQSIMIRDQISDIIDALHAKDLGTNENEKFSELLALFKQALYVDNTLFEQRANINLKLGLIELASTYVEDLPKSDG